MIRDMITKLLDDPAAFSKEARESAESTIEAGRAQVWKARTRALERAGDLLDRVPPAPIARDAVGRVVDSASRLVEQHLEKVSVENYDDLNSKEVVEHFEAMNLVALEQALYHENHGKKRKNVVDKIEREIAHRADQAKAALASALGRTEAAVEEAAPKEVVAAPKKKAAAKKSGATKKKPVKVSAARKAG